MKKQLIITKLFEFGGSNAHLKTLIHYFGPQNVVLLFESEPNLNFLENVTGGNAVKYIVKQNIHPFAHLAYPSFLTNINESLKIARSAFTIFLLQLRYRLAGITICAVEPEKYLYLLWQPFSRVTYILHSFPHPEYSWFSGFTCNKMLGKLKRIITVSEANKGLIIKNWQVNPTKKQFINVIYNCTPQAGLMLQPPQSNEKLLILTMGHVIAYKNPAVWLEVAKIVTAMRSNVSFLWLGNGPLLESFKLSVSDMEQVKFEGLVAGYHSYLNTASIYYQPSLYETHGIAVVEAMSYFLPVVASNTGGLPESITQHENGFLVNCTDAKAHVDALIKLIDSPALRSQYGLKAHNKYMQLFQYDTFKANMDAVYDF